MQTFLLCLVLAQTPVPVPTPPPLPPADPFREMKLVRDDGDRPAVSETRIEVGRFTNFPDPGEKTLWDITPLDSASTDGIVCEKLGGGAIVLGWQQGDARPGKYRVPAGNGVYTAYGLASGKYVLKAFDLDSRKLVKTHLLTVFQPAPTPVPVIPPGPVPVITPVKPGNVNAALLETLKAGLADDEKDYAKYRDTDSPPSARAAMIELAAAYAEEAARLSASSDPAAMPKDWGTVLSRLYANSKARKIPLLPALSKARYAVADYVGAVDASAPYDAALATKIAERFPVVAATLKEAATK